jgi:hypothetical protein
MDPFYPEPAQSLDHRFFGAESRREVFPRAELPFAIRYFVRSEYFGIKRGRTLLEPFDPLYIATDGEQRPNPALR